MEFCICSRCGGAFEALLIEQFCKVCLMEMQAETEAEHQRELLQEKTAMEQQARAEDAVSAFRAFVERSNSEFFDTALEDGGWDMLTVEHEQPEV